MANITTKTENLQSDVDGINPAYIYWTVVVSLWLNSLFYLYLFLRQRRVYLQSAIPAQLLNHMKLETFEKARRLGIKINNYMIFSCFYWTTIYTVMLHFDVLYLGWVAARVVPFPCDTEICRSTAFTCLAIFIHGVAKLPFAIYILLISKRQTSRGFVFKDFLIKIFSYILLCPAAVIVTAIDQAGGQNIFVWLVIFCFLYVMVLIVSILRMLRVPNLKRELLLDEQTLKSRIEALARRVNFPLIPVYFVKCSRLSALSKTNLNGYFGSKRIVLQDTLISGNVPSWAEWEEEIKMEQEIREISRVKEESVDEENEAVLAHKLGHWKLNHVFWNLTIVHAHFLITFGVLAIFYRNSALYQSFGFPEGINDMPVLLEFIIVLYFVLSFYNAVTGYLRNLLNSRFELQADAFAVRLGYAEHLKSALIKGNKRNLSFPVNDPLYTVLQSGIPTLLQRLEAIDLMKSQLENEKESPIPI